MEEWALAGPLGPAPRPGIAGIRARAAMVRLVAVFALDRCLEKYYYSRCCKACQRIVPSAASKGTTGKLEVGTACKGGIQPTIAAVSA